MSKEKTDYIEIIQIVSNDLVAKLFPEELEYFDSIWSPLEKIIKKWVGIPPEKWTFDISPNILKNFGFADLVIPIDVNTVKIIIVTAATIFHISSFGKKPHLNELIEIVRSYCERVGSLDEQEKITALIADNPQIGKLELSADEIRPKKEYTIFTQNGQAEKDLYELDVFRAEINEKLKSGIIPYHIWIDEPKGEVVAFGKKVEVTNIPRKFLIAVLKRNGEVCRYTELFVEVWKGIVTNGAIHYTKNKVVSIIKKLRKYIKPIKHGYYLNKDLEELLTFCIVVRNMQLEENPIIK